VEVGQRDRINSSSFAYDKCNVKQAGGAQHFVVGHTVMPANDPRRDVDTAYERSPVFSNRLPLV